MGERSTVHIDGDNLERVREIARRSQMTVGAVVRQMVAFALKEERWAREPRPCAYCNAGRMPRVQTDRGWYHYSVSGGQTREYECYAQ